MMLFLAKNLLLIFIAATLKAAAPLTHLYLTDIWYKASNIHKVEKDLLLRGSTFPDIRYIANIAREDTHAVVAYEDILLENDTFKKGCLLHSYIDITREDLVEKCGIYDFIEDIAYGHK